MGGKAVVREKNQEIRLEMVSPGYDKSSEAKSLNCRIDFDKICEAA